MNATNRILDELSSRYKVTSNYGLHKLLGVAANTIGNYRHGKTGMADDVAIKAAKLLDDDAGPILAELKAERAETDEARKAWQQIAHRLRRTAAVVTLGIAAFFGSFTHSPPVQAAGINAPTINIMVNIIDWTAAQACRATRIPAS